MAPPKARRDWHQPPAENAMFPLFRAPSKTFNAQQQQQNKENVSSSGGTASGVTTSSSSSSSSSSSTSKAHIKLAYDHAEALPPNPPQPHPQEETEHNVLIMGYKVAFPAGKKPFPAQLAVMSKVLTALKSSQHALLESPTGSGKTLALLCSTLTFQQHFTQEIAMLRQQQAQAAVAAARKQAAEAVESRSKDKSCGGLGGEGGKEAGSDGAPASAAAPTTALELFDQSASQTEPPKTASSQDDDFISSPPSFDQFRFGNKLQRDYSSGWISMQDKKNTSELSEAKPPVKKRRLPKSFQNTDGGSSSETAIWPSPSPFSSSSASLSPPNGDATATSSTAASSSSTPATTAAIPKPPQIFFCSRTHSQLTQVADEVKRLPLSYRSLASTRVLGQYGEAHEVPLRTCVLGARAHFCANRKVNRVPSQVDEQCSLLLSTKPRASCQYFNKYKRTNSLRRVVPPVWDIEELNAFAKKHRECSFFFSRDVYGSANVVFCPYNYIFDPLIREALQINLNNAIVVLDEAHNVEDCCRSCASCELTEDVLVEATKSFHFVLQQLKKSPLAQDIVGHYLRLLILLRGCHQWLAWTWSHGKWQQTGFEQESQVFSGSDAIAVFEQYAGVTADNFKTEVLKSLEFVARFEKRDQDDDENHPAKPKRPASLEGDGDQHVEEQEEEDPISVSARLTMQALKTVESICGVMKFMYQEDMKYLDDFRLIAVKSRRYGKRGSSASSSRRSSATASGFVLSNELDNDQDDDQEEEMDICSTQERQRQLWQIKFCIWCLSANVVFREVAKKCRSVLLTSGTLSPMETFCCELGVDFPVRLEANHVVNMQKQVLVGTIPRALQGQVDLCCTYVNQQTFEYQDAIGKVLCDYAQVIPGGLLVFVSSYSLMDKLLLRWTQTGKLNQIQQYKQVFTEPRQAGKEFDTMLEKYKQVIASTSSTSATSSSTDQCTGAIFLAVYRGKVSEGIDFANDNARAVLAIGIPYPNVKELQVNLKRQYQDAKAKVDRQQVSGAVWYQHQAYRALNQALGRCIRHRLDYGSIFLLDSRHCPPSLLTVNNNRKAITMMPRLQPQHQHLSKWIRGHIRQFATSELTLPLIQQFFQQNRQEVQLTN